VLHHVIPATVEQLNISLLCGISKLAERLRLSLNRCNVLLTRCRSLRRSCYLSSRLGLSSSRHPLQGSLSFDSVLYQVAEVANSTVDNCPVFRALVRHALLSPPLKLSFKLIYLSLKRGDGALVIELRTLVGPPHIPRFVISVVIDAV
jgi:hypothetical protein